MDLPHGSITERVYRLISKELYHEAAGILEGLLHEALKPEDTKECHGLLSLHGYCLYMMRDFEGSAQVYSQLQTAFPDIAEYQFYKTYSLLHCTPWKGAPDFTNKLNELQKLLAESPSHCRELTAADAALLQSAILCKQGFFEEGGKVAAAAMDENGWSPALAYNQALCAFQSGDMKAAATIAETIISRSALTNNTRRSLQDPAGDALVEAVNLRCAVEIINNRLNNAKKTLTTIPLNPSGETDCITLHNQALTVAHSNPAECIKIFESIFEKAACPPTTLFNLLVLYCKQNQFEAAANVLAQITEADFEVMSPEEAEFLHAFVLLHTEPLEAQQRLEALVNQTGEQFLHLNSSPYISKDGISTSIRNIYEHGVAESLLPALMALVRSYCTEGKLDEAEKQMRRYESVCSDQVVWKKNMAHLLFMQKKYNECLSFYKQLNLNDICKQGLRGWQAKALAHELAAHIILGDLGQAQQLLDFLNATHSNGTHASEEGFSFWWDEETRSIPHLSFAKLVIGTLYCAEKAYDYGLRTATEAVEPIEIILSDSDAWSYIKECIAALLTDLALGVFLIEDQLASHVAAFLRQVENKTTYFPVVAEEARKLRQMLLQLTIH